MGSKKKTYLVGDAHNPPTAPRELPFETRSQATFWQRYYQHTSDPFLKGRYELFSEDEYKLYCDIVSNNDDLVFLSLDVPSHTIEEYKVVDFEQTGRGIRFIVNKGETTNSTSPAWNTYNKDFYFWFSIDNLMKIFKEGLYAETYLGFNEYKVPFFIELSRICGLTLGSLKRYVETEVKAEVDVAQKELEARKQNYESLGACVYGYGV